jgi:signal peptidase II
MPRKKRHGAHFALALCIICEIIFADQYSKWLVMETILRVKQEVPGFTEWFTTRRELSFFFVDREEFRTVMLAPWLNLVMVWNQGVSFGLFDTNAPRMWIAFAGLSALISLMLFIWLAMARSQLVSLALALVIGGAIGNIIDRARFAAVVDFIDVHAGTWHWPAFNLADSCIVLGAFLLMLDAFGVGKTKKQKGAPA